MKKLSLCLCFSLLLAAMSPTAWAEERTVHISSAEDLARLASDCVLDSYSQGLTVILDNDIDLGGRDIYPIPSFSGAFDGGGHTISGLSLATDGSHQGLFRYVQAEGTVKNLKVSGGIVPENGRCQAGGIAGTNYGAIQNCSFDGSVSGLNYVGGLVGENYGTISGCEAAGTVDGKRFTGGIAGFNQGSITDCRNRAAVNTAVTEGKLDLDDLHLSDSGILSLTGAEDTDVVSDSGGIAGFSRGAILSCVNFGPVGYQHYGYNVGGIAGRQSGLVSSCENRGSVLGKKDVGGIVGQMEPFMLLKESVSLGREMEVLNVLLSEAMWNLDGMSQQMDDLVRDMREKAEQLPQLSPSPAPAPTPTPSPTPMPSPEPSPGPETPAGAAAEGLSAGRGGRYVLLSVSEQPSAPPVGTTEQPVEPTEQPTEPTEQPTEPTEQPVEPTEPPVEPSEQPVEPSEQPAEPTEQPVEPSEQPVEPSVPPAEQQPALPDIGKLAEEYRRTFQDLRDDLSELLSIVSSSSGELSQDLVRVGQQMSKVLMMLAGAISEGAQRQLLEDISGDLPQGDNDGRVSLCVNSGGVEGDSDVGGVAGAMGIEYEFDMENVLADTLGVGGILTNTYQTKCVSSANVNRGAVTGKRDNVGGVAGLQELGLIDGCQSYGGAESTDGGYVGGIVGLSQAAVRGCYAMCDVSGTEYVGGIAGGGSEIQNCGSLVGISGAIACAGAIAGWADMGGDSVSGNTYVGDGLGAVDGISYSGRAQSVSYEEFVAADGVPEQFSQLSLSFVADGETVAELGFSYGGSIDTSLIPAVPEKEGCTGRWPDYDYSRLYFSDTLEAVYTGRLTTLASDERRGGGPQSIVLLEGDFGDGASLALEPYEGDGPQLDEGRTVMEKWTLSLIDRDSAAKELGVRYLPPAADGSVELYVLKGGVWRQIETESSGKYLSFSVSGDSAVFCAVERVGPGDYTPAFAWAAAALALAALAIFAVCVWRRRSRKKKRNLKGREKS